MIDKSVVKKLVEEWLQGKDYFLTDLNVSADDRIVVEIDHKDGVWIEDCVALSRYIEEHLDRDVEDYELEVGSAGIGQPFKVHRQYEIHVGDLIEVIALDGRRVKGTLREAGPEHFTVSFQEKVKEPGAKRPRMVERDIIFAYKEVKETRYIIDFK